MHLDLFKIIFLSLYLSIRLFQDDLIKHPKIAFLTLPSHTFRAVTRKRLGEFFFFLHFFRVYTFFFNICHFEHRFIVKRWKDRSTLSDLPTVTPACVEKCGARPGWSPGPLDCEPGALTVVPRRPPYWGVSRRIEAYYSLPLTTNQLQTSSIRPFRHTSR